MRVAILGASNNQDRASFQAVQLLAEQGYEVLPIHPKIEEIEGIKVFPTIRQIPEPIDTLTIYVSPEISYHLAEPILESKPKRIIFNPGAESEKLELMAQKKNIETLQACTLTLLKTNQF